MQKKYFNSQDARNLINIYGFSIFPIHGIQESGLCTCNNPQCVSPGKHPATPDGFKSASKDIERVKKLWAGRSGLNVGIATGEASGVFVIDIDSQEAEIELKKVLDLPQTYSVKTGRGKHLYFKYDKNNAIKNATKIIEGVDIRGNGGYVAGPGSIHANGSIYEAINPLEVIADAPQVLYDFINKPKELNITPPAPTLKLFTNDGWSQNDIVQHLSYINPDCDYDTWIKIGMALHEEGAQFSLWDDWSRRGTKYDGSTAAHWKSFHKGKGISYGTVVALAKQGGWQKQRNDIPLPQKTEVGQELIRANSPQLEKKENHPTGLYYIPARDIKPHIEAQDFVQGLLGEEQLSVVYGESNCGKTFFAADLAMHVALGHRWRDKRVEQGGVMYAALEGARGFSNRISAYRIHNVMLGSDMPLAVMPCQLDFFSDNANIQEFIDLIKKAEQDIGKPKLIVIDTLARALAGGDENSGQDMGRLVYYADAIRLHTKAHLCFIHHSGKNKALGARGHSSLRAAVDTEIEISRDEGADFSRIRVVKQREMDMLDEMAFALKVVTLGKNQHGEDVTSCVVVPKDTVEERKEKAQTAKERFVYEAIMNAIDRHGAARRPYKDGPEVKSVLYRELAEVLEEMGYGKMFKEDGETTVLSATKEVRIKLRDKNLIGFDGGSVWILSH